MTDTPPPLSPYVVGIEKQNMHGLTVREHIASFRERADAVLFSHAYNDQKAVYGSGYSKTTVWELRYVR